MATTKQKPVYTQFTLTVELDDVDLSVLRRQLDAVRREALLPNLSMETYLSSLLEAWIEADEEVINERHRASGLIRPTRDADEGIAT